MGLFTGHPERAPIRRWLYATDFLETKRISTWRKQCDGLAGTL
jgi:hypothetical protein